MLKENNSIIGYVIIKTSFKDDLELIAVDKESENGILKLIENFYYSDSFIYKCIYHKFETDKYIDVIDLITNPKLIITNESIRDLPF